MTTMTALDLVAADMGRVRDYLQRVGEGDNPILVETIRHLFGTQGKYIRPALCLLVGRLFHAEASERLVEFAAGMEVVHTASLVHDDTLDDASTRRGNTTVNAGWNGHIAILVGDYLFAQSAIVTAGLGELRVMAMLADMIKSMVRGELLQMETVFDWEQDEAGYDRKIGNKTAALFALCTEGAGVLAGASDDQLRALRDYGYSLGLAFQIVDDILDVTEDEDALGKPSGSDLAQGKVTLPVIYYLRGATLEQRALVQDTARVDEAVAAIRASTAVDQARARAGGLVDAAVDALGALPAGEARAALGAVARSVVHRTH